MSARSGKSKFYSRGCLTLSHVAEMPPLNMLEGKAQQQEPKNSSWVLPCPLSWNHRKNWVGKTFKGHPVQHSLQWAGTSSTGSRCSEPCQTWPWMFPGMGQTPTSWPTRATIIIKSFFPQTMHCPNVLNCLKVLPSVLGSFCGCHWATVAEPLTYCESSQLI